MSRYRLQITVIAVVVGVALSSLFFLSQKSSAAPPLQQSDQYHFSVKFVCGVSEEQPTEASLAPGFYNTSINIHDPLGIGFKLEKWAVQALPEMKEPGRPTEHIGFEVGEYGAFEIDCPEIWDWFGMGHGTFMEGFVHLQVYDLEPEVVAVYTAQGLDNGPVSIEVERYPSRAR